MGYFDDGLGLILSNSFDEKSGNKKQKQSTSDRIRSLVGNDIFCPKCGTENYFELEKNSIILDHFCKKCNVKLNVFWETYQDGYMPVENCEACEELTFNDQKFCISCGLTKAMIERLDEIGSDDYKPKRQKWFIIKKAETWNEKFFSGRSGKVRKLNPHHPKAYRNRILYILFYIMIVLLAAVAGVFSVIYPMFSNW